MSAALIVTADDFGLHASVNAAVERAYRDGILTAASLMVGGPAARDAVARARTVPGLRVGLHLVLADGPSVLPPRAIPDLVDAHGRFGVHMVRDGVRYFCLPRVRRQLALEIRAQLDAFAATGLALDHVNAHKHFHVHPTILSLILRIGAGFGLRAIRLPRATGPPSALRPWLALLEARLDAAGIVHNDYVIGIRQSGQFDERALLDALRSPPTSGIGEVYLHPALLSGAAIAPSMRGYRHADEFAALVSPRVREARDGLRAQGWRFGGFADVAGPADAPVGRTGACDRSGDDPDLARAADTRVGPTGSSGRDGGDPAATTPTSPRSATVGPNVLPDAAGLTGDRADRQAVVNGAARRVADVADVTDVTDVTVPVGPAGAPPRGGAQPGATARVRPAAAASHPGAGP